MLKNHPYCLFLSLFLCIYSHSINAASLNILALKISDHEESTPLEQELRSFTIEAINQTLLNSEHHIFAGNFFDFTSLKKKASLNDYISILTQQSKTHIDLLITSNLTLETFVGNYTQKLRPSLYISLYNPSSRQIINRWELPFEAVFFPKTCDFSCLLQKLKPTIDKKIKETSTLLLAQLDQYTDNLQSPEKPLDAAQTTRQPDSSQTPSSFILLLNQKLFFPVTLPHILNENQTDLFMGLSEEEIRKNVNLYYLKTVDDAYRHKAAGKMPKLISTLAINKNNEIILHNDDFDLIRKTGKGTQFPIFIVFY